MTETLRDSLSCPPGQRGESGGLGVEADAQLAGGKAQGHRRSGSLGLEHRPFPMATAPQQHWAHRTPPPAQLRPRAHPGATWAETYPCRVHHALGRSGRARREHNEERVAEGQLLELQLGHLVPFPGGKKVIQKHAVGRRHRVKPWARPPSRDTALAAPSGLAGPEPALRETGLRGSQGAGGLVSQTQAD